MTDRTLEPVRIGFWGQTGSGKTVLLAGYYSYLKRLLDVDPNFDLVPFSEPTKRLALIGEEIKKSRSFKTVPSTSVGSYTIYNFAYCHEHTHNAAIPIEWIDYSGQYWQAKDYEDADIIKSRIDCLKSLCTADVVILLFDGDKFVNDTDPNHQFTKTVLDDFRKQINLLKQTAHIRADEHNFDEFVIAMSKCNLIRADKPRYSARDFKEELERRAGDQLRALWREIGAEDSGRRYLLLSTCEVEKDNHSKITELKNIGLDAIAPIAFYAGSARAERIQRRKSAETSDGTTATYAASGFTGLGGLATIAGAAKLAILSAAALAAMPVAAGVFGALATVAGVTKLVQSGNKKAQDALAENISKLRIEFNALRTRIKLADYYYEE